MTDNIFLQEGSAFYAEAYNGALLLQLMGKPKITMEFPKDYPNSTWAEGDVLTKMVQSKLVLENTEISGDNIILSANQLNGKITFTIYPNIEPIASWGTITWTGGSLCDVYQNTTLLLANQVSGFSLSGQDLGCEVLKFEFSLNNTSSTFGLFDFEIHCGGI